MATPASAFHDPLMVRVARFRSLCASSGIATDQTRTQVTGLVQRWRGTFGSALHFACIATEARIRWIRRTSSRPSPLFAPL